MAMPFCFQVPSDVTRWRPVWCAFPSLHCASTASTNCWKKTISPRPKCPLYLNYPLDYPVSPRSFPPCLPDSTSYLNESLKFPSRFPSVYPSFPSTSLRSPRNFPRSLNDFPAGFPTDFPNVPRSCLIFRNASPTSLLGGYLISRTVYPVFLSTCPAFLGSARTLFRIVWAPSDLETMPKPQQQQEQQESRDLELDHLVRQSPLHISRTPSPSSPSSVLDLPNVPFYPRLPPISPSRQFSGLSNPNFNAEDDPTSARPSGDPIFLWFFVQFCAAGHFMRTLFDSLSVHCV